MQEDNSLQQAIEDFARRLLSAKSEREKKRVKKELDEQIARPILIDDFEKAIREFETRLKGLSAFPPGFPSEYQMAFSPLVERLAEVPPHEMEHIEEWDLWTTHMARFQIQCGAESLSALLQLKAFELRRPSQKEFEDETFDSDDIERARKTRECVDRVEREVIGLCIRASRGFIDALRGRLNTLVEATMDEALINAINEGIPNEDKESKQKLAGVRDLKIAQANSVEKVRLGTRSQSRPRETDAATIKKKILDAMTKIDKVEKRTKGRVAAYFYGRKNPGGLTKKDLGLEITKLTGKLERYHIDYDELVKLDDERRQKLLEGST